MTKFTLSNSWSPYKGLSLQYPLSWGGCHTSGTRSSSSSWLSAYDLFSDLRGSSASGGGWFWEDWVVMRLDGVNVKVGGGLMVITVHQTQTHTTETNTPRSTHRQIHTRALTHPSPTSAHAWTHTGHQSSPPPVALAHEIVPRLIREWGEGWDHDE